MFYNIKFNYSSKHQESMKSVSILLILKNDIYNNSTYNLRNSGFISFKQKLL